MPTILEIVLKYYHTFGVLNIFLLFILILAYSDNKKILWYGAFVFSIALDLFNYIGLFSLFNYSPNFTLPYLPWSIFATIAFYKLTLVSQADNVKTNELIFKFSVVLFIFIFCYFIVKSYWVLLGDITIRDSFFITSYTYPLVEYWVIKTFNVIVQCAILAACYSTLFRQSSSAPRELYLIYFTVGIITLLSFSALAIDIINGPDAIISKPNPMYLTVVTTLGLIVSYRKIIGINYNKKEVSSVRNKSYTLDNALIEDIQEKILTVMEEKRLYKNRKLQLRDLSSATKTSENYISEVLSKKFQTNYYDFINQYRVEEVIKLMQLETHRDYKLMALATESGFNSKTTFNSAFKKVTGKTPSEYRKQLFAVSS